MKDALTLLITKLAEWVGYPKVQLAELYAPLDLMMRDAITFFLLYPEVMVAPEVAGNTSGYQMRQAFNTASKIMDEATALNEKMETLIREKWHLVDRDDVKMFLTFLERQLRIRHTSKVALKIEPEVVFDAEFAKLIHFKTDRKRRWPFTRLTRGEPYPKRTIHELASIRTG